MLMAKKQTGFTIVELLIVIVVIGILAAITIVAYNGVQTRARDAKRASDVSSITNALEAYHAINGTYPQETATGGLGAFEYSTDTAGTFMEYLTGDYFSAAPLDPINDGAHRYWYYVYPYSSLSSYGCPVDKGELMVFYASGFENSSSTPKSDTPLVCPGRTWSGYGSMYFMYRFENG